MMSDFGSKQVVVFKLGKEEYGFEVSSVREIHSMEDVAKVHRAASHIEGVINLRGKLLTVINLRARFGMEKMGKDEGTPKIVVIDSPEAPVGFMVDEVSEVARVSNDMIEKAPSYVTKGIDSQYVLGIAKLDDRLVTLIDPIKILELEPGKSTEGGEPNV